MASRSNNSGSRLQNWHESFSTLDDDSIEEDKVFDYEYEGHQSGSKILQENNRSFVDFLYDNNAASTAAAAKNHHNSFYGDDFIPVEEFPVVRPETLSDSFIERAYPT